MGNINNLTRYQSDAFLNNLSFTYNGNQMKVVDDTPYGSEAFADKTKLSTEYLYDTNGSMTYDANSGISTIQYNVLNVPNVIQFKGGHQNLYTYDASGKNWKSITIPFTA